MTDIARPIEPMSPTPNFSKPDRSVFATLRLMLPQLWPYRGRVLLALAFLVAAKLATIAVPLALKELIDRLEVPPSLLLLPLVPLIAYGALRLSSSLFQELRQIVFARVKLAQPESLADFRARMRRFCQDKLARYAVPQKVELVAESLHGERFKKMRRVDSGPASG